jgi:hypothetical protein
MRIAAAEKIALFGKRIESHAKSLIAQHLAISAR